MKFINRQSIFFKLISLMIIVSILPITLLAFYLNRIGEKSIRESVSSGFENISKRTAHETITYIGSIEKILYFTSDAIADTHTDTWKSTLLLRNIILKLNGFKSLTFIGTNGKVIIDSGLEKNEFNYSRENIFSEALRGKTSYSEIKIADNLMPVMKIAVPVKRFNKVIGALIAEITVRYLWELADNIKIGQTGYAYILDQSGTVIAHPNREHILKYENFSRIPLIGKIIKSGDSTAEYFDVNGTKVLGSGIKIPDLGWIIVIEQSTWEAFYTINKIRYLTIFLALGAIIFAGIAGYYKASQISAKIGELKDGTKRIAQGDLNYSLEIESEDEIGEFAKNFNQMAISLKNTQEQLIRSKQLAVLGSVSSKIAHEIKNPLESIKGANVFLRNKFSENKDIQKFTKISVEEINKLNNFINQVLISTREIKLEPIAANINDVLKTTCELISNDSRFDRINIIKSFDNTIPNSYLDPGCLQRAFLNVMINAMQAIGEEGEIKINTKFLPDEDFFEIIVQDNGIGMSEEIKENIFKPAFTTKKDGTGLGLSYFYEAVKEHRGCIKVDSRQNQGSSFFVYLPYKGNLEK